MPVKPRLLTLTPDFPPSVGGIQLLLERLIENLPNWDHHVVARRAGQQHATISDRRTRLQQGPASIAELNVRALQAGVSWAPDVVLNGHVNTTLGAIGAARGLAPIVTYAYADELTHRPRVTALATRHSAATIAISRYTRDLIRGYLPAGPVPLILPGFDRRTLVKTQSERPTILTVSRLTDRYKGHDVVLDAMPAILRAIPEARWLVVGDGPLRKSLEARRDRLGLGQHVEFLGYLDDVQRDALFGSADVFVMPSRLPERGTGGEGFGIVYLEAAAAGLPVVAGNVAGATDAIDDSRTGLLVDPTSADAVGGAVISILTDRDRARAMGRAGRAWAATFTWERMASQVNEVLQSALLRSAS